MLQQYCNMRSKPEQCFAGIKNNHNRDLDIKKLSVNHKETFLNCCRREELDEGYKFIIMQQNKLINLNSDFVLINISSQTENHKKQTTNNKKKVHLINDTIKTKNYYKRRNKIMSVINLYAS